MSNGANGFKLACARVNEYLASPLGNVRLDLSGLNLSVLPPNIADLRGLQLLSLNDNQFKEFPAEIGDLHQLHWLYLDNNNIAEIPDEISLPSNLEGLSLNGNRITDFPHVITELKNLRGLFLNDNRFTEIPNEIGNLLELKALSLHNNLLTDLPSEIGKLKNLEWLYLNNNKLSSLPKEIEGLTELQYILLFDNELHELPREIMQLSKLKEVHLQNNPKLNVPPEISSRSRDPQLIFSYYFENIVGRPLNEIKMLLLGEGKVGKTSLVKRLIWDDFDPHENKTDGVDIHKWNLDIGEEEAIQVNVWDFGGQEIMHATHQFFLTARSLYLLVLDSRKDEKGNQLEDWLKVIQNFGGSSPLIVVCNMADEHDLALDERSLRAKYPNIVDFIKTSCSINQNIKLLEEKIVREVKNLPHVFDSFSQRWFSVKKTLEHLEKNYIPYEEYEDICRKNDVDDSDAQEILIKFLHDLGVVLNFRDDGRLNDTNVLKPEWITQGVYKILNAKKLADSKGVLSLSMVEEILDAKNYPKQKHLFILQMMQKFERCFRIRQDGLFLVPDLLPKEEPDFKNWKPQETGLGFQYHYEISPHSFITRFIVNMNEFIVGKRYWRKGVVLRTADRNKALVKADLEDKRIFIWIDGKMETRRGFLSMIRRQFERIHESITHLRVKEFVQHEKGLISYKSLLKLEEKKFRKHYFPDIDAEVNVMDLLNGIETIEDKIRRNPRAFRRPGGKVRDELFYEQIMDTELMNEYYDVALSFAGEDREFVDQVYEDLREQGILVFYDADEDISLDLWGKDLIEELDVIYRKRSRCVVIFVSSSYKRKMWTNYERRSALAKTLREKKTYVLPARFDDTELPGLLPTLRFEDLRSQTPSSFAEKIIKKLKRLP